MYIKNVWLQAEKGKAWYSGVQLYIKKNPYVLKSFPIKKKKLVHFFTDNFPIHKPFHTCIFKITKTQSIKAKENKIEHCTK